MIQTERLSLRHMTESDFHDLLKIFTDEKVMQSFGGELFTHQHMRQWIERNLDHQQRHGYGLFAVILKATNQLIGDCGLEHGTFNNKPCAEIGYDFLSDYWNQGYATEAAAAVRDYALHTIHLQRESLCSFIRQENMASIRVSQKIGMIRLQSFEKQGIAYYLYGFSQEYFA
ncbi:GNAT family N-acetyltransferase [bacterium]|nr:GNAT family N-acetyltransferase [bacterium]